MMRLVTILILAIGFSATANDISKINQLKKNAEIAFKHQQYDVAVSNYSYLIDTLHIDDEQAIMNLGHSYYQLNQKDLAQAQYQKLVLSKNEALKSVAYQQLGAMSTDPKTLEKSMSYFKESIKSDPSNQDARYNYELVKKRLKEQKENQDQNNDDQNKEDQENEDEEKKDQDNKENEEQQDGDQNKDQEKQDSEEQEEQDQQNEDQEGENDEDQKQDGQDDKKEGEEKEQEQPKPEEGEEGEENGEEKNQQPPSPSDKMQEMNISEEKAKMILEALKNSEIQYIQQNRRKPTKRKDSDKPDW